MIPLRDDVPARSVPWGVLGIMLSSTALFLYTLALPSDAAGLLLDRWGLVPREFLRGVALPSATQQVGWLTPLSSMFLHGGLLHLVGNLFYLWIFGVAIEGLLGHARFVLFYFVCGLVAAAAHIASDPTSYTPTLGASGAISGVLGGYAVSYPSARLRLLWPHVRVPAVLFLVCWIALQVASGVQNHQSGGGAGVAWWAHVGGFVAGAILVRSMWVVTPTHSRLRI